MVNSQFAHFGVMHEGIAISMRVCTILAWRENLHTCTVCCCTHTTSLIIAGSVHWSSNYWQECFIIIVYKWQCLFNDSASTWTLLLEYIWYEIYQTGPGSSVFPVRGEIVVFGVCTCMWSMDPLHNIIHVEVWGNHGLFSVCQHLLYKIVCIDKIVVDRGLLMEREGVVLSVTSTHVFPAIKLL